MLILSRKAGEKIIATLPSGQNVEFTVLGIKGGNVRLGIAAPKNVVVDREEVHQRKIAEKAQ